MAANMSHIKFLHVSLVKREAHVKENHTFWEWDWHLSGGRTHRHQPTPMKWHIKNQDHRYQSWQTHVQRYDSSAGDLCGSPFCGHWSIYNSFTHPFNCPLSGTTWVSWYQKGKTNLDLLEQETVSGSGISWAICNSAPHPRQITMPASHHSVFYRWGDLPAAKPTVSKHWRQMSVI